MGRNAWALEQLLTFANVSATVRTVVIKLQDGTLWVDGPQWPTGEYMALLDELGPVGHVVLPCVALEHKAPMAAFVKRYPKASVWIAPGQYGPFGECGLDAASAKMGYRVDGVFPTAARRRATRCRRGRPSSRCARSTSTCPRMRARWPRPPSSTGRRRASSQPIRSSTCPTSRRRSLAPTLEQRTSATRASGPSR